MPSRHHHLSRDPSSFYLLDPAVTHGVPVRRRFAGGTDGLRALGAHIGVRDVWNVYTQNGEVPEDSAARAGFVQSVDSFVAQARAAGRDATGLRRLRRFVAFKVQSAGVQRELRSLQDAESWVVQQQRLRQAVSAESASRVSIREQLKAIDYFAGVKYFAVTIILTYLMVVGFIWLVGTAIESAAMLIGLSRDVAALRDHLVKTEAEGSGPTPASTFMPASE